TSSRMGRPKQLLPIHNESLLRHVAHKALAVPDVVVAIVGNAERNPEVSLQCVDLPVTWIENRQAHLGLSTSITAGVQYVKEQQADAIGVRLGDQPVLDAVTCAVVVADYRQTGSHIVQAEYGDRPGDPVVFDQSLFADLFQLEGDTGAKTLLKKHYKEI